MSKFQLPKSEKEKDKLVKEFKSQKKNDETCEILCEGGNLKVNKNSLSRSDFFAMMIRGKEDMKNDLTVDCTIFPLETVRVYVETIMGISKKPISLEILLDLIRFLLDFGKAERAVSKVDFDFLEHLIEELRAAYLNDVERKLVEKFFKSAPRCPVLEELLPFCYLTDKMDLRFLLSGSTLEKKEVKIVKKGSKAIGNFEVYPNYVLGFEFKQDADGFGRIISVYSHAMKYCILNVWYLKPETKDGPPRLNFWNEVGKGKLEPKIVPMELEKDKWYRVVVKQIQSKSGKYNLSVTLGGKEIRKQIVKKPKIFDGMKFCPGYTRPFPGRIRNVQIASFE